MLNKNERKTFTFFSSNKVEANVQAQRKALLKQFDFTKFQMQSTTLVQSLNEEKTLLQWTLFCKNLSDLELPTPEKMHLAQVAFQCLLHPVVQGEFAQWIAAYKHLKEAFGLQLPLKLVRALVPDEQRSLSNYLRVFQILLDLAQVPGITKKVHDFLPDLNALYDNLLQTQTEYLNAKYPQRNIEETIKDFSDNKALQFPLRALELEPIKADYLTISDNLRVLKSLSEETLQEQLKHNAMLCKTEKNHKAKNAMLAILAEGIRRTFKIVPYDTQLLSLLALLNTPEKLKGRIAQIHTGEGKSTIIAMLAAFMGASGEYVDVVTSSAYLAIRDCKKYLPFFKMMGLTASHISHDEPKQAHFHARILYGTNTDFEFAMLRDGLYNMKLRYSQSDQGLIIRPFDTVIIDEVDNLFLDAALHAAQLAIRDDQQNVSWIFPIIFDYVKKEVGDSQDAEELRDFIGSIALNNRDDLEKISDAHLLRWARSANTAIHRKQENKDYILKAKEGETNLKIVPVDYACTGRSQEGTQWMHGVHQFTEIKHNLKQSPTSLTGASLSHPSYFNLYAHLLGLTGTVGEAIERQEIQNIYQIDSFDVPPHFKSLRDRKMDVILPNKKAKWEALLQYARDAKQKGLPLLILFKTIQESNDFSAYLVDNSITNQVLNETQRQSEDYIVAQAGEAGMITVATNTAGRGTDFILSPKSLEKGGLQMIFAFYPDNLRVQGQGFGRAGRQGQPGNCWMVLDSEDDSIQSLMRLQDPLVAVLKEGLEKHFDAQGQTLLCAEALISMLNALRTSCILQQSKERSLCATQEKEYFYPLQDFFTQMEKVCTLVESDTFKLTIEKLCNSDLLQQHNQQLINVYNSNWVNLKQSALLLLEKTEQNVTVDWSAFSKQFAKAYLDHIRNLWASYYSKLKDSIEKDNRESAYNAVVSYLSEPEQMAEKLLSQLLTCEFTREKLISVFECKEEPSKKALSYFEDAYSPIQSDSYDYSEDYFSGYASGYASPQISYEASYESEEEEVIDLEKLEGDEEKAEIVIAELCANGALNNENQSGWTMVLIAANGGLIKLLTLLAKYGADFTIPATKTGETALYKAALKGHAHLIPELTKHIDVDKVNNFGASPLFIATQEGHLEAVKELLNQGADYTLCFSATCAILRSFAKTKGELVISKMDALINQKFIDEETPIAISPCDIAFVMGHEEIVQVLESKSAIFTATI